MNNGFWAEYDSYNYVLMYFQMIIRSIVWRNRTDNSGTSLGSVSVGSILYKNWGRNQITSGYCSGKTGTKKSNQQSRDAFSIMQQLKSTLGPFQFWGSMSNSILVEGSYCWTTCWYRVWVPVAIAIVVREPHQLRQTVLSYKSHWRPWCFPS